MTMTKPRNQANMPHQDKDKVELQARLREELEKAQETTKKLESDRVVSNEILHETFTL